MSQAELMLLMLDEAAANGAELVWAKCDTAPDLGELRNRKFDFKWQ